MAAQDTRLEGRIAVVTGASSGLGRAIAIKFGSAGARVVCADLRPTARPMASDKEALVPTHEVIQKAHGGDKAIFIQSDASSEAAVKDLVAQAVQFGGRLDIMVNNAGIATEVETGLTRRIHDTDVSDYDKTHAINQRGVWLGCKYAITQMLLQEPRPVNERGDRTRGWIINTASMLGVIALANAPCYVPTKHGTVGITKQVALDYAKDRIHCNALCPGFVKSAMIHTPGMSLIPDSDHEAGLAGAHPWATLGRPQDVADAAMFLASDEAAWVTGHCMIVDGGYTAQ